MSPQIQFSAHFCGRVELGKPAAVLSSLSRCLFHWGHVFSILQIFLLLLPCQESGRLFSLTSYYLLILMQVLLPNLSFHSWQHSQHEMCFFYYLIPYSPAPISSSIFPSPFILPSHIFHFVVFPFPYVLYMREPYRTTQLKIVSDIICDS